MTTVVFVDSTTLIYPLDRTNLAKKSACEAWLRILRDQDRLTFSPQVLNETYWAVMRKPAFAHAKSAVRGYLRDYAPWMKAPLGAETLEGAFALEDRYGVRFWDALLLASANAADCDYFLSEDLNDGQVYGGVTVVNPFRHSHQDVLGPPVPS